MTPQLSIITVVYNGKEHIAPTIESVIGQNFDRIDYIIIDGSSNDGTLEIIESYKVKYPIHLLSEPDRGIYDAMNKGLNIAKGEYVLFLNAGDELASSDILSTIFKDSTNADIYYGETNILNTDRRIIGTRTELTSRKLPAQLKKKDFLNGQVVSHQSFMPKRALCELYNLKYKCSADIDWMLKIISNSKRIVNVNQPVSNYLQGGISDRLLLRCWWERFSILLRHFNSWQVFISHIKFVERFLRIGKYHSS